MDGGGTSGNCMGTKRRMGGVDRDAESPPKKEKAAAVLGCDSGTDDVGGGESSLRSLQRGEVALLQCEV